MADIQTFGQSEMVVRVGKRGTIVLPAKLRRRFRLEEGSTVLIREGEEGITLSPAVTLPVEIYTPERKAEFLLSNAVDEKHYKDMLREVRKMGLDPGKIPHYRPGSKP